MYLFFIHHYYWLNFFLYFYNINDIFYASKYRQNTTIQSTHHDKSTIPSCESINLLTRIRNCPQLVFRAGNKLNFSTPFAKITRHRLPNASKTNDLFTEESTKTKARKKIHTRLIRSIYLSAWFVNRKRASICIHTFRIIPR